MLLKYTDPQGYDYWLEQCAKWNATSNKKKKAKMLLMSPEELALGKLKRRESSRIKREILGEAGRRAYNARRKLRKD